MIFNASATDQDVVQLVLLVDQRLLDGLQVADGVLQQRPVVGEQVGDRSRGVADVGGGGGDRVGPVLQPVISTSKFCSVSSNCFWCLTVVSSTVLRLRITSPIAWSRSASAE